MATVKKSVSIDAALWAKVVAECHEQDRTASWVVSRALEEKLGRGGDGDRILSPSPNEEEGTAAAGRTPVDRVQQARVPASPRTPRSTATKRGTTATGRPVGPVQKGKRK